MNVQAKYPTVVFLSILVGCGLGDTVKPPEPSMPVQLHLTANDDGSLKEITLNQKSLGNGDDSFRQLESTIVGILRDEPQSDKEKWRVDVHADGKLRFEFVHRAIAQCSGHREEESDKRPSRIEEFLLVMPNAGVLHGISIYVSPFYENRTDEIRLPEIRVRLTANDDGSLKQLFLGRRNLGNDSLAFERLNNEIRKIIGRPGNPLTKDLEVEIDGDKTLRYQHVFEAVKACSGRLAGNKYIVYIDKLKFTDIGGTRNEDEFQDFLSDEPVGPVINSDPLR